MRFDAQYPNNAPTTAWFDEADRAQQVAEARRDAGPGPGVWRTWLALLVLLGAMVLGALAPLGQATVWPVAALVFVFAVLIVPR